MDSGATAMQYVKLFNISDFKFRFADGVSVNAYDIVSLGPLSPKPIYGDADVGVDSYKRVAVLHIDDDKGKSLAETLATSLSEGYRRNLKIFPGLNRVLRTNLEIYTVPFRDYDPGEIFNAFELHSSRYNTFPIIILPRSAKGEYDSIYYRTKAVFLRNDTPCQVVTKELVADENNLRWSLLSISLQVYAKMGGIPYGLNRYVLLPEGFDTSDTMVAVAGLGISTHPQLRKRGAGFIIVFDHMGVWNFMDVEVLAMDGRESLSDQLAKLFDRSLSRLLQRSGKKYNILVIHYSGKEIGRIEEEALRNAVQSAQQIGRFTAVYILKIRNSDVVIGCSGSIHVTDEGVPTWYPPIGAVFKLKPDVYLLVASGYFTTYVWGRESYKVKSNIRAGLPSIKVISRHREVESGGLGLNISDMDLLQTVFGFMRLNYRAVQNPVTTEPVTVRFSREIAWIILRLADLGTDIGRLTRLSRVMWFL